MKKTISFLLVIIITCSALTGCDWKNIISSITAITQPKWEAPDGVIETTVTDKSGDLTTIAHSDNFTQDDIDFVTTLHNELLGGTGCYVEQYTLADVIALAQYAGQLFLMHFARPYIIAAYLKPHQQEYVKDDNGYYNFDATKYVWYRFDDTRSIPQKVCDMELSEYAYLLYDCMIVRDIATGIEYNRQCKYYLKYSDESSLERTTTDMVMCFLGKNIGASDVRFIKENRVELTRYQVYTDEAGIQYLVLLDEQYLSDENRAYPLAQMYLEEYYDCLYPHFVRNESLDIKYMHYNGVDYTIYRMKQIELEIFVDLLFENEEN